MSSLTRRLMKISTRIHSHQLQTAAIDDTPKHNQADVKLLPSHFRVYYKSSFSHKSRTTLIKLFILFLKTLNVCCNYHQIQFIDFNHYEKVQ